MVAINNFLQSLHVKLNEAKTVVTRFVTPRQLLKINPDKTFSIGWLWCDSQLEIQKPRFNNGCFYDIPTTFLENFEGMFTDFITLEGHPTFNPWKTDQTAGRKPNSFEGKDVPANDRDSNSKKYWNSTGSCEPLHTSTI